MDSRRRFDGRQRSTIGHVSQLGLILVASVATWINVAAASEDDSSSKNQWTANKDSDQDDDDSSDSYEDDKDESKDKTNTVILATVPVVLGVVAILLVCLFMMCRRNRRQQAKRSLHWLQTSPPSHLDSIQVTVPDRDYEATSRTVVHPVTQGSSPVPSAPPDESVLPPSYEEVLREQENRQDLLRFYNPPS